MNELRLSNRNRSGKSQRLLGGASLSAAQVALRWLLFKSLVILCCLVDLTGAQSVVFQPPDASNSIGVAADQITSWQQGQLQILHLNGNVQIHQQFLRGSAAQGVLLIEQPDLNSDSISHPNSDLKQDLATKVTVYLENELGNPASKVEVDLAFGAANTNEKIIDSVWLGRLFTRAGLTSATAPSALEGPSPAIVLRALKKIEDDANEAIYVRPAAFIQGSTQTIVNPLTGAVQEVGPAPVVPDLSVPEPPIQNTPVPADLGAVTGGPSPPSQSPGGISSRAGQSTVSINRRDPAVNLNLNFLSNPQNPSEGVWLGTGGAKVEIDSPEIAQIGAFQADTSRKVVILADNIVAWQSPLPDGTDRWEMYLEGNVIFAKGSRVIYADRMHYDANTKQGTILSADVYTPVADYPGLVRLKADVVQQVDENTLQAYGAAFTSSRLAFPRYWLQSENIEISRQVNQQFDPQTGLPQFDNNTGQIKTDDEYFAASRANRVYIGGVPVFAWPSFRSSLNEPSLYLNRLRLGNDSIFGTQIFTGWNLYKLLGIRNPPQGTEWTGLLDYLSERGLAWGTEFKYQRNNGLFGYPGIVRGNYQSWFINDSGEDDLGRGRFGLTPEEDLRGRVFGKHYHKFAPGVTLKAELGWISDRNFLESFFEREWDTEKDATTGFWLERNVGTQSFNLTADIQVNDFFTQTSWLPRLDHFVLGQPLFLNRGVWHGHSHIGYGRVRAADAPLDPAEQFDPLAWENDVDGIRVGTRHEIDFPQQIGPAKVVPYVLGDATFWQEDLNGDDLLRAYGQIGVRASLPFWKVDPTIQSVLWNVNGLAHKVTFDIDAFYADASQDLEDLALYDQLDDDSQEAFRRRFAFNTFDILPGGDIPLRFDERFFALRSGLQSNVSSPSAEIADDLAIIKLGVHQRWQTKRGMPGNERIIDWITLDVETSFFPDGDRDNFGSDAGLLDYDFRWYIGDRLSLVSDGFFDFFDDGLRTASIGLNASRPEVGNVYLGFRSIEGPISSNVLTAALTYRMSEKWGARASSQIDFGETGTIGNTLNLIYIGESFLWNFGVNADLARDNVGFRFGFEPRFLNRSRIFNPGGQPVPPAGSRWLE